MPQKVLLYHFLAFMIYQDPEKSTRRNYIAKKNIKKNTLIKESMFELKRSSFTNAIKNPFKVKNKILKRNLKKGYPLLKDDI